MFLTGPAVVREVMGEDVDAEGLGGPRVQAANGVCHFLSPDPEAAAALVRELLGLLPETEGTGTSVSRPAPSRPGDPGDAVPGNPRRTYDVREVIARLVDGGRLLEYGERWARNVCCGFARIDGRPVGIVANQPKHLGGVLDAGAASKAARFVRTCHLFGVPLLALVDTPGFLPGTRQEAEGVIRHGAKLVHAFAEASVPKLSVVLRKSFGGAHIAMNAKGLGADLVLAWPQATLGVMGAEQAVGIVRRRDIAAADDPGEARRAFGAAYAEEHLGAARAAADGFVDEVVAPGETRDRLAAALALLDHPRPDAPRAHNVPL
jgi:acetyl-CoA carboxylase carboxyltransferase component